MVVMVVPLVFVGGQCLAINTKSHRKSIDTTSKIEGKGIEKGRGSRARGLILS
ncbi:hypothetical protein CsatB_009063 [Cannabis sativa]